MIFLILYHFINLKDEINEKSEYKRFRRCYIFMHELAHMYFGNYF